MVVTCTTDTEATHKTMETAASEDTSLEGTMEEWLDTGEKHRGKATGSTGFSGHGKGVIIHSQKGDQKDRKSRKHGRIMAGRRKVELNAADGFRSVTASPRLHRTVLDTKKSPRLRKTPHPPAFTWQNVPEEIETQMSKLRLSELQANSQDLRSKGTVSGFSEIYQEQIEGDDEGKSHENESRSESMKKNVLAKDITKIPTGDTEDHAIHLSWTENNGDQGTDSDDDDVGEGHRLNDDLQNDIGSRRFEEVPEVNLAEADVHETVGFNNGKRMCKVANHKVTEHKQQRYVSVTRSKQTAPRRNTQSAIDYIRKKEPYFRFKMRLPPPTVDRETSHGLFGEDKSDKHTCTHVIPTVFLPASFRGNTPYRFLVEERCEIGDAPSGPRRKGTAKQRVRDRIAADSVQVKRSTSATFKRFRDFSLDNPGTIP